MKQLIIYAILSYPVNWLYLKYVINPTFATNSSYVRFITY